VGIINGNHEAAGMHVRKSAKPLAGDEATTLWGSTPKGSDCGTCTAPRSLFECIVAILNKTPARSGRLTSPSWGPHHFDRGQNDGRVCYGSNSIRLRHVAVEQVAAFTGKDAVFPGSGGELPQIKTKDV